MRTPEQPLVSVVTPVYNGEKFLAECIESVLNQTYQNYEYLIVNNCSKDRTLEIALSYANKDGRIRVHDNETFLSVIANHNHAFSLICPSAKYCKIVSADDWLFPECLTRMVSLAEANSSVGIVGSYQLSGGGADWRGWGVRWDEVPYPSTVIPGKEICRLRLLGGPYVFGTPTSILYRSDLVKGTDTFYPNSTAEADTSACYKYLHCTDFGFVHQILSYERNHDVRMTTRSKSLNAYMSSNIGDLLEYGPLFLSAGEIEARLGELMDEYYAFLATSSVNFRDKEFWGYHKRRLKELGYPLDRIRLSKAISMKCLDLLLNPKHTIESLVQRNANLQVMERSAYFIADQYGDVRRMSPRYEGLER